MTELDRQPDGRRTLVVILSPGDELVATITGIASEQGISAAGLTAIGAFERVTLGYFQWDTRSYRHNDINEQVELASLIGNLARHEDGSHRLHAHGVVGTASGQALAGHILEAHVRPTCEVIIEESPAHLVRRHDEASGLALISLDQTREERTSPAGG
ncbi:MAG: DUF296 domain-containing protein [Acidimicrobiales bacterium]